MSTKPATTDVGSPEAEPLSADEVELYRERLRRGRAYASITSVPRWLATIDALRSEVERLRDGLKSVANCDEMDCYLRCMADDLVCTPTPGDEGDNDS